MNDAEKSEHMDFMQQHWQSLRKKGLVFSFLGLKRGGKTHILDFLALHTD